MDYTLETSNITACISYHNYFYSPFQDDFVVLHVKGEYDTVIETVLKTEFLTLLSEKYSTMTTTSLQFSFNRR